MNREYSQLPPVSIEAEEAILGSILFDNNAIFEVAHILPTDAFYLAAHRKIYEAVLSLIKQDKPTDLINVADYLNNRSELAEIGGTSKLTLLLHRTISAINIDRYANLVLDKYTRRRMIQCGQIITELGYDQTTQLSNALDSAESSLFKVCQKQNDNFEPEEISHSICRVFGDLDSEKAQGLSTGIIDLDAKIGGLKAKSLYILAARASMGKTWVACNLAKTIAEQGKRVVFFSAEMSKDEISARILAMISGVNSAQFSSGQATLEEKEIVASILDQASDLPIILDDSPARLLTPQSIRSKLRKISIKSGKPDLIILDYLQKLGTRSAVNRAQVVGEIVGELKDIAKEFDLPVVCLAQINRGVENRNDKRPMMSDLKDSGDIEQDGDIIMTLYRDEYYHPDSHQQGILEINVAKNRYGEVGVVKVLFDPQTGAIKPLYSALPFQFN